MYKILDSPKQDHDVVNKIYVDSSIFNEIVVNDGKSSIKPSETQKLELITDGNISITRTIDGKILFKLIGQEGDDVPALVERTGTVTVPVGENVYVPITVAYNKYDLRTLKIVSLDAPVITTVYDNIIEENGDLVYTSHEQKNTYDILMVPVEDKSGQMLAHIYIQNMGTVETEISYTLKITNLL